MRASAEAQVDVIVAGDLFRFLDGPSTEGWAWHQRDNLSWLVHLIGGSLATNPDIKVGLLDDHRLGEPAERALPPAGRTAESWWSERYAGDVDPVLADAIRAHTAGKVVVGFELPPSLRALLDESASALLELEIAPIRFMDDLLFAATSNNEALDAAVRSSAVSDREIRWHLGTLKARIRAPWAPARKTFQNLCLLACQLPSDRSLLTNDGMDHLDRHLDELRRLASEHDLFIVKPHPHAGGTVTGVAGLAALPGVRITSANAYRLLASGSFDRVVSISSSLLAEARYFGVKAYRLGGGEMPSPAPMIRAEAISGPLAEAIAALCGQTLPPPASRLAARSPVIAGILGYSWGSADADDPRPLFGGFTPRSLPSILTPGDASFASALTSGWHAMEEWGVWCGQFGVLTIQWPAERDLPLLCILTATLRVNAFPAQGYSIFCDGECLASGAVPASAVVEIAFTIPRPTRPGPVQLWLLCRQPFRPSDMMPEAAHDTRLLGLGLMRVDLR